MELHTSHGAIISKAMLLVSDNILGKLYTYTPDGIRSSKTVNGTKTEYLLNGTQILAQKTGSDVMWFFYDSTGTRIGVQQGNVTAYYMYNLQGDVVGLADAATGKIIAKYLYDAWGKCVSVENAGGYTIGTANPFRYRGYYYDNETGFYYLNSRYYNPEVGRFLNADSQFTANINGINLFSYCYNCPIAYKDDGGKNPLLVILAYSAFEEIMLSLCATVFIFDVGIQIADGISQSTVALNPPICEIPIQEGALFEDIEKSYSNAKVVPKYKTQMELHHIVPQNDHRAANARLILLQLGIDINSSINTVYLPTSLHRRLHTQAYYNFINYVIPNAYNLGRSYFDRKRNVESTLVFIKAMLITAGEGAPF